MSGYQARGALMHLKANKFDHKLSGEGFSEAVILQHVLPGCFEKWLPHSCLEDMDMDNCDQCRCDTAVSKINGDDIYLQEKEDVYLSIRKQLVEWFAPPEWEQRRMLCAAQTMY